MKTFQLAILIFLTFFSSFVFGQISINQSDIWAVNDTIPRVVDTISSYGQGNRGAGQIWNFINAVPRVVETTRIITASSSPYASSFTTSNQAMTHDNSSYLYVNSSSSNVLMKGVVGDLLGNGGNNIVPFNPSMLLMQFPESYGTTYTSAYAFDFMASGSSYGVNEIRVKHTGTVFDTLDGWGTIITPAGTYNCLRKKIVENKIDSTWYQIFAYGPWTFDYATPAIVTSYSWLAKETKLAVAELSLHPNGSPYKLTYSLIPPQITTGIQSNSILSPGFKLYPNPANDNLHFIPPPELSASVFDIHILNTMGQEVYNTTSSSADGINIDISSIAPGLYFIDTFSQNGLLKNHGVFSVVHH